MSNLIPIGRIDNIEIRTTIENERKIKINYIDLSPEIRDRFQEYKKKKNENKTDLNRFLDPLPNYFKITSKEYSEILELRESILYHRSIDNKTYLKYLLQSLLLKELKDLCKNYVIKGYSKYTKQEIINYLCDNLSDEEIIDFLKENEYGIISLEIGNASKIIYKNSIEKITWIKIANPKINEVNLHFKGIHWEGTSFISITDETIDNPERDCLCISGSHMGFCPHFWIGFIYSLKKGFFNLSDWKLTLLPDDFKERIQNIDLTALEVL